MYIGFFFTKGWLGYRAEFLSNWRHQELNFFNNSLVVHESTHKELKLISERLKNIENKLDGKKHD
jgi:hypothetical protein